MSSTAVSAPAQAPTALLSPYEQALCDLTVVLRHRLSSLTTSIEGYTDLLVDTLGSPDQRDMALRIFEGVRGIESVLTELDLAGAPLQLDVQPVAVKSLLNELWAALDTDARRLYPHTEIDKIEADPLHLRQALVILVKNALEAAPDKAAVVLEVHALPGAVAFDVLNEGMPAAAEGRLFAPFYTTKAQNLGLGLALARRIAHAHGGELVLHRACPEEGTCFRLTLPHHSHE